MKNLSFGEKLIDTRRVKGLTQEEVAEKCNIAVRTIQRIESGVVKPRASTIKIISEQLGFIFFESSKTNTDPRKQGDSSKLKVHTPLWYIKDLFNLKTKAMKKLTILSTSISLILFLISSVVQGQEQTTKNNTSLNIEYKKDKTLKRLEVNFASGQLTLDSLVRIKEKLNTVGVTMNYQKIQFNIVGLLEDLECQVITNDGFSGSFSTGSVSKLVEKNIKFGFYRDYSSKVASPFGTGQFD
jgi:transcriptional regulator with XRE-family HTH domain